MAIYKKYFNLFPIDFSKIKDTDIIELDANSDILKPYTREQVLKLNKTQLINLLLGEQDLRQQAMTTIFKTQGLYVKMVRLLYVPKTEKSKKITRDKPKGKKKRSNNSKKPSDRNPNAKIENCEISIEGDVICEHCDCQMHDSGLRDTSEVITLVPAKFKIQRHLHVQYKCSHCSHLKTTPRVPRIKPGSNYSDQMIIAAAIAKYCDLIPMNRYASMIRRESLINIPPNSLIELTHYLASFCKVIERQIKQEVLSSIVLKADETPHMMFEHVKKNWYLWGFSSDKAAFFECHASRSGDVAADILQSSSCKYLLTDVYAGYSKAVDIVNNDEGDRIVYKSFCNAHARRKFIPFKDQEEVDFIIRCYGLIYKIEKEDKPRRRWQMVCFNSLKKRCEEFLKKYSMQSELYKAARYFLKNFDGLVLFTKVTEVRIPIDNNSQERLLRSPVIGRKTWFGTHSLQGAQTASTLFTIIESCKLNKIDPRKYLELMTLRVHKKEEVLTPSEAARDFPQIAWQGSPPRKTD